MDNSITILMIDDREDNLLALEAVLASPGLRLVALRSGEEALRYILREPAEDIAMILLDVQMPGMNGFETARLIKARKKTMDIPIVFLTAISKSFEQVLEGYKAGSIDYIFKPFDPELLRLKVDAFVRLHRNHLQARRQSELLQKKTVQFQEANRRLERAEALARMVSETSIDAVMLLNEGSLILSMNPGAVAMFGYRPDELIGERMTRLLPDFDLGLAESMWETTALHKDGTWLPVDCQMGKSTLENACFYAISIRDASSRKQMEQLQREQYAKLENVVKRRTSELRIANRRQRKTEKRFKTIFLSSPCAMTIRRLSDSTVLDVNESFLLYTGYTREETTGTQGDFLKLEVDPSTDPQLFYRESCRNQKVKFTTKLGESRDGLLSSEIIEIDDEKCTLNVITDITDKVKWEKEMARLARLNLVGEMAAGIAHEIRNPMTTIRGFLQMSKRKGGTMSPEYIDIMLEELQRANGIITEYLSLAKNKATDRRPQSLNAIVETLFPLIQAEAMLSGKYVQVSYGKLPQLQLDEKEIRQLILNLTMNGLEAMPLGGILRVETHLEQGDVVLKVRDQGTGIKKENIDKLGTPFFTTKDNGTGLGLAVCYSIASRHQATIDVRSNGEGTTFRVRFNQTELPIQGQDAGEDGNGGHNQDPTATAVEGVGLVQ